MIVVFLKFFLLLAIFGALFSFIPKFSYLQVKKLLTYHDYSGDKWDILKQRFYKVLRVYILLGITLGIVFMFIFSFNESLRIEQLGEYTASALTPQLILLSFLVSFSLVIILRVTTLLNKSKLISKALSVQQRINRQKASEKCNYRELRLEITSFLFSVFLSALLSLMIYIAYRILFVPYQFTNLIAIGFNMLSLGKYILFLLAFVCLLALFTLAGELLLYRAGVRPGCLDSVD
ncbi:MAG: hypothetical protein V1734_03880 [Nanoarchaeota archaeon]